ncbi:uncharacterized protein LOC133299775 [Gastrolobium bilobum]|uniref:uncharacterized protein LOC133299775 n=1 Tax=Gastrolobium bilobum TaxID=150636 RepID=UPI002AB036AB|nr:uncharacterized protein LOC133299775 [Gastrolobium bilobum]
MKIQELTEEFLQYRDLNNQNNQRAEQLLMSMEAKFQELQSSFCEILPHISRAVSESNSNDVTPPHQNGVHHAACKPDDHRQILKFVKPEIPKFDGKEPNTLIFKAELFFKIQQVPAQFKLELAGLRIDGVAADWFQWIFNSGTVQSWEEFIRAVRERFGPSNYNDVRGLLAKLMQNGSLADYMAEFQKLMNQVTNISDELFMTFFVAGLQPDLQGAVQLRWPTTFHQAMQLAIAYDSHHGELRSSITNQPRKLFHRSNVGVSGEKTILGTVPSLPAPTTLPIKRLSPKELQKKRDLGQCYTCEEKWTSKHRCKTKMLVLFAEDDESEGDMDEEILWRKEEHQPVRLDAALHSLSGSAHIRSLNLVAVVGKRELEVLIESGSSHNFIKRELAEELHLPMVKARRMRVFMGNVEFLLCDKKCAKVQLLIQGHIFETDLYVVDLCDLCIVLGMQWLITLGRVTHNYAEQSMEFMWHDELVVLEGMKLGEQQPHSTQTEAICHSLLLQQSYDSDSQVNSPLQLWKDKIPAMLWSILVACQKVFDIPTALPPFRDMTHAIHLLDETKPIKVKPYRYPHHQKTEIERQVEELLASGWIQQSHSAFSSPVLLVRKQDSTWRMCIDYRALNSITVRDAFPIPTIDELLDELFMAKVFSKLIYVQVLTLHWPTPHSIKQLRAFLGLTGYYRRFVKGYASIAHPLTELLKQDKMVWNPAAELTFQSLKEAMAATPVLQLLDFTAPFIVE